MKYFHDIVVPVARSCNLSSMFLPCQMLIIRDLIWAHHLTNLAEICLRSTRCCKGSLVSVLFAMQVLLKVLLVAAGHTTQCTLIWHWLSHSACCRLVGPRKLVGTVQQCLLPPMFLAKDMLLQRVVVRAGHFAELAVKFLLIWRWRRHTGLLWWRWRWGWRNCAYKSRRRRRGWRRWRNGSIVELLSTVILNHCWVVSIIQ